MPPKKVLTKKEKLPEVEDINNVDDEDISEEENGEEEFFNQSSYESFAKKMK